MKFIHLSDLHIGKRVNEFSMIEDQRYILDQIIEKIKEVKPEAVLIAGDVYDKPLPPAEAVRLFDDFIYALSETGAEVMIISGNHDSAERLSFGSRIMDKRGVHFAGVYDGSTHKVSLPDEYGSVNFYMLPFIKPVHVKAAFPDDEQAQSISSFNEAIEFAISKMDVDTSERNVLIAHQFVTGALRSESEEVSIGGLDNVDAEVFKVFDYTALGHLHGPQSYGASRIRYCGSPLKYSFSEASQTKSFTVVEFGEKKDGVCKCHLATPELVPLRDMREMKGTFAELTDNYYCETSRKNDYLRIVLTDEEDIIGALQSLRAIYPNIMRLDYDNERTRASAILPDMGESDMRTPIEIFSGFYESQNGKPMDDAQADLVSGLIEKVWGDEK